MILDGVSYYNVGFSLEESAKFLERSYGVKADASTISHWVKELSDICSYGRLREFGLKIYSPAQVVQSFQMYHRQIYRFRYHRAKIALALQEFGHYRFAPLREYLDSIATDCPHYLFKESDRSSEIKAEMDLHEVRITEKQNRATQLAQLVLQAVADNKWRHDALQKFMLANDSVTVATEVPVSVLNDIKFPTPAAKYWQAMREQNVMFQELVMLSYEYRKNLVEIWQRQGGI